ncbi:MAG: tungsten ABC transporter substrate-binding protein [Candidatus Schekmanbacteria bacterium RIFCSPHIGHO2_02_FULL_38_11]|uniref:Tungsten ABC transporter substrate-binding protein n=1 Tax=Candidatus Schekmanbacteria bacterium RIFCSPLOWO2_12_FULL_38_15 TaxID=1817883 RepID=A0A1F7SE78_9BACT|nr:MAG: tungsten ABC transporter substrate-binding protein [Candidatus Schekmanbacteria bacterium GWA2_38_9]OGL49106.1 MAG: tungsten ABC transporter substrate-binding protein [Candidatus Schekmanbacteria bacterium RIFCSPLOWO2_02_FULL_38_14]OGL49232.1 MAG: tungsten ABC transporter substrate-binding protein [Candidatus Schekmanbacteria bacterium RIFCSPHIGHO2_02_FULL_38_11]OGL52082.1 MAG: tungsten ABC transporter substrate-binding protein [Candidatus Schekmanbacteria bacterium RIFCSPLOWO2_12_FULL_3
MRKKVFVLFLIFQFALVSITLFAQERLKLSTTTSTENTGLLNVLLPPFEKKLDVKVDIISVGTGQALKLAENGDVDVTLVHAKKLEDEFMAKGFGVDRRDVMYNDFVIIGPKNDPAGVKKEKNVIEAFKKIAEAKVIFISRGDNSGTHTKEKECWEKADIKPSGNWYVESGKGMGEVINMADEKMGYTLSDRGTYLAYKSKCELEILFEGDSSLFNPYSVIAVNPEKHPHVNYKKAKALVEWITSVEGQKIIGEFGKDKFGQALFVPTAIK